MAIWSAVVPFETDTAYFLPIYLANLSSNFFTYFATEKSSIKRKLFTPGTLVPVTSDSQIIKLKVDYALLLAWNFSKEIIKNNIKFLKKGGKFIIPIPKVKIIDIKNYKSWQFLKK